MPLRLPPLSPLRFFEAAGRLQSFRLAAAELKVTPSAVSHGIAGLEEYLGVQLFDRGPRGLSLTPAGADYLAYVSEALAVLAVGTRRLPAPRARPGLSLTCAPTFASRWLVPRLAAFRARWPDVDVSLDTSPRQAGFPTDGFDFAIRMSRTAAAGPAWTRLFAERLVPLCSPAYRDSLCGPGGDADLRRAVLIHVPAASEEWQDWLQATGLENMEPAGTMRVDRLDLAFEAAVAGLGVALGRRPLVDDEIAAGTLVAAGPTIDAETAYWLVARDGADQEPALAGFRLWLLDEMSGSVRT
ncbi:LysR substrate-binding domain-containing protein [Bordetella genomosp. 11]|uniref:Transcriptional regulator n=1 Tax=Bordetella genomosp. 11 TaxID=1416808 RepID=A0A261UGJ9_9BORD|nr:LysR substrate-binding domain-containing protein [Bordetella genomosp. 11]OZI61034.1 transcriptional regulator [Bordetella genomosp. 11]